MSKCSCHVSGGGMCGKALKQLVAFEGWLWGVGTMFCFEGMGARGYASLLSENISKTKEIDTKRKEIGTKTKEIDIMMKEIGIMMKENGIRMKEIGMR